MSIEEFDIINVDIKDIELDPTNPNVMSTEQMAAISKSMKKYGYLVPVIIDQNNKICDGEHRLQIYKDLGMTKIPAYKVRLETDADRRQLRQIMNKLHGEHDKARDADEFLAIMQNSKDGSLAELAGLLGQKEQDLNDLLNLFHNTDEIGSGNTDPAPSGQVEDDLDLTDDTSLNILFHMPDKESYITVNSVLSSVPDAETKEEALIKMCQTYTVDAT